MVAGTFELGWKIGTGANAKFLKIGVPERSNAAQNYAWNKITWRLANSRSYYGALWPNQDGWVISLKQTCCNFTEVDRWFAEPCTFSGFVPPEPFVLRGPVPSTANCHVPGEPENAQIDVLYGWAAENGLPARGPIEDYTNQPYTRSSPAPTPPPQTTVEQAIENELEQPENELLRQWLNYQLGSPGETDPLGIGAPNPVILPSPEPGETGTEYAERLEELELRPMVSEIAQTDPTKSPSEVVSVDPEPGSGVQLGSEITVRTNPPKDCETSLFHYTDLGGAAGVMESSSIVASDQNGPYPSGAYTTTIPPSSPFYDQYELAVHLFSEGEKPVSWWVKLCGEDNPDFHPTQAEYAGAPSDFWNASAPGEVDVPIIAAGTGPNPMARGF